MLVLISVASMANGKFWLSFVDCQSCDEKCYYFIKKCYDCLDTRTCPPTFPSPLLKEHCDKECYEKLPYYCQDKFEDCFECNCPNLEKKEECPFEGATIKNEDCCEQPDAQPIFLL